MNVNVSLISSRWISTIKSNENERKNIWKRIRYVLNIYWKGTKLLYRNSQLTKQIRQKNSFELTRNDRQHLREYSYDIKIGIPFVVLFALPIVGYSAPLIALLSPKSLPSTFILPQQKRRFLLDDAKSSSQIVRSLIEFNSNRFDEEKLNSNLIFVDFDKEIQTNFSLNRMEKIVELSRSFDLTMNLKLLSREHLLLLHQSVLHSSDLARQIYSKEKLCFDLEVWQWKIYFDDQSIDHVDNLSIENLVFSLYHRGIYLHEELMAKIIENHQNSRLGEETKSMQIDEKIFDEWKENLRLWIFIHKELFRTNSISTSFLLHLFPFRRFHLK